MQRRISSTTSAGTTPTQNAERHAMDAGRHEQQARDDGRERPAHGEATLHEPERLAPMREVDSFRHQRRADNPLRTEAESL